MYLRPPVEPDYAEIASWVPDAEAARRWAGPLLTFPFSVADLPAALAAPGSEASSYCLSDVEQRPLGFGQHWVFQPGAVHLGRIIVSPDARGRGVGRFLCEQLLAAAVQSSQATSVTLRVYRDNAAAIALYASLGFLEVTAESSDEVLLMKKSHSE